jgi:aryl-alcohol dehydrogenase-like predicted oxidoreductase
MIERTLLPNVAIPALGLGCWAIGGPFTSGGVPAGWGAVDDAESIRAIHLGVERGVRFFDTAQTYGCGHSETVLGRALANRPDVRIGTKVGYGIDRSERRMTGVDLAPASVEIGLEASLYRLRRDRIDIVHLHIGDAAIGDAEAVFDRLDRWVEAGRLGAWGWSTDDPARAASLPDRANFRLVQMASNVFDPNLPTLKATAAAGRLAVIRSPLAMGLLGGRYSPDSRMAADDIRAQAFPWLRWFQGGQIAPAYRPRLAAVQDLLRVGGRSLAQGAVGWLWAKSPVTLPIPGFRTEAQVADLTGALEKGPLPRETMDQIEAAMGR